MAVLFPVIIALVLAIVQGALWAHAGAIAQAAADHGVEVAASLGSTDDEGVAAAIDFVRNAGTLANANATANNAVDSEFVTMTVTGSYPSVFGSLEVSAESTTTRERVNQ